MSSELPPFAQQWVQQWKQAAPRLQAIRDEELRRLGTKSNPPIDGIRIFDKRPYEHGMVTMQRWFMRQYLLDSLNAKREKQ